MSDRNQQDDRRTSLGRRAMWMGLGAAALVATLAVGGAVFSSDLAMAHGGARHGGHWGHDGDPAEHAAMAAEWIVRWVDGTPAQQDRIAAIVVASMADLEGLRERHRAQHDAFLAEMSRDEIDRAAIEGLRTETLVMADEASAVLAAGLADVAEVLTAEQRIELIELAERFHRRRH